MEAVLGVLLGFGLSIFSDVFRQRLEKRRRNEERSERAIEDLVLLLDKARRPFLKAYRMNDDVDDEAVAAAVGELRQKSLLLNDLAARERIELIAEILENDFGAREFTGDSPSRVAWVAWNDGRTTLRCLLDGKPVGAPSADLSAYKSSIDEGRSLWEEHMKEEAERRDRKAEARSDKP